MLFLIGLGLSGVQDLTLRAFDVLKNCQKIYLESYTSVILNREGELTDIVSDLKSLLMTNAEYVLADRELVEYGDDIIKSTMDGYKTAFLVVGDPLSATTHTDLILRAVKENVNYEVIHNTSIMTAVGSCGLQLYKFGETVSIPFWDKYFKPTSYIEKICNNMSFGLNTLCLLDIKVKEQSLDNLMKGKLIYEAPRFMTCSTAASQILEILRSSTQKYISENTLCVGVARLGCKTQSIFAGTLIDVEKFSDEKLGGPLHSLIIVGKCDQMELSLLSHVANIEQEVLTSIYELHKNYL